jgi:hypothetical protein
MIDCMQDMESGSCAALHAEEIAGRRNADEEMVYASL